MGASVGCSSHIRVWGNGDISLPQSPDPFLSFHSRQVRGRVEGGLLCKFQHQALRACRVSASSGAVGGPTLTWPTVRSPEHGGALRQDFRGNGAYWLMWGVR